eukprot:5563305-Prymnesium_polylepis.1
MAPRGFAALGVVLQSVHDQPRGVPPCDGYARAGRGTRPRGRSLQHLRVSGARHRSLPALGVAPAHSHTSRRRARTQKRPRARAACDAMPAARDATHGARVAATARTAPDQSIAGREAAGAGAARRRGVHLASKEARRRAGDARQVPAAGRGAQRRARRRRRRGRRGQERADDAAASAAPALGARARPV